MKYFLMFAFIFFSAASTLAADVAVSISMGQPGFYGQIDIGDYPPPQLIYAEPVIVEQVVVVQQPIYLRVQQEHVQHWDRYCNDYNACGQRVYFVEDGWYDSVYVPTYDKKHGKKNKNRHSKHKD